LGLTLPTVFVVILFVFGLELLVVAR
jgi:hypothetical protein